MLRYLLIHCSRSAEWLGSSILVLETDLGPEIGLKTNHFHVVFGFILGISVGHSAPSGSFWVPVTVVLPLHHSHAAAHRREFSSLSHSSHWVSCPGCEQKIHRRTQAPPTPSPHWLIPLESLIRNGEMSHSIVKNQHIWRGKAHFSLCRKWMFLFVQWARPGHWKQQWKFVCSLFYLKGRERRSRVDTRNWNFFPLQENTAVYWLDMVIQIQLEKQSRNSDMLPR